jgi:hypothetical protein
MAVIGKKILRSYGGDGLKNLIAVSLLLFPGLLIVCMGCSDPTPISSAGITSPAFIGGPAEAKPMSITVREHPFLAPGRISTLHAGGGNSDVHLSGGPLGHNPKVVSRKAACRPGGMCSTVTFDRNGRLVTFCGSLGDFEINLLEPRTLRLLATYELPIRPSTFAALVTLDPDKIMADTSGGAYFYQDSEGYVVLADSHQHIVRIGHREIRNDEWEFYVEDDWDLSDYVPHDCLAATNWFPEDECDPITSVLPDYNGLIWWVTRFGRIGTLNSKDGAVKVFHLEGEEIQNSFAAAEDGMYIVSDHAMYGLDAAGDGTPRILWKELYDRGSKRKPGLINQGAGSTPTLIGDDYVATTDNADDQVNLVVYRRAVDLEGKKRLVCRIPLFKKGASAAEISMIAWDRSIILENTFGYLNSIQQKEWQHVIGGLSRIDIREDESDCGCDTVWTSTERSPSVVGKLSAANGLVYVYTFEPQDNGENAWYLTALDAESGQTAFKILTGSGSQYDNNWGVITLGPDNTAYVSATKGLVAVWDED